jgi:hypothetical protein
VRPLPRRPGPRWLVPTSSRLPKPHAARATSLEARALATHTRASPLHCTRRRRRSRRAPPLLCDNCTFATRPSPTPPSCHNYKSGAPSPSHLNAPQCPSLLQHHPPLGAEQQAPHPDPTPHRPSTEPSPLGPIGPPRAACFLGRTAISPERELQRPPHRVPPCAVAGAVFPPVFGHKSVAGELPPSSGLFPGQIRQAPPRNCDRAAAGHGRGPHCKDPHACKVFFYEVGVYL